MSVVMTGKSSSHHAAVTPITLSLQRNTPPSFHPPSPYTNNLLPSKHSSQFIQHKHRQHLQYEPDSAKCFIYRTQMHLQGLSTQPNSVYSLYKNAGYLQIPGKSSSTLPVIRNKSSVEDGVTTLRQKSVAPCLEAVTVTSKEILQQQPNISGGYATHRQAYSQKDKKEGEVFLSDKDQRGPNKLSLSRRISQDTGHAPRGSIASLDSSVPPISFQQQTSVTSSLPCDHLDAVTSSSLPSQHAHVQSSTCSSDSEHIEADSSMTDQNNNNTPYSIELKITQATCSTKKTKRRKKKSKRSKLFNHRLKALQKSYEPTTVSSDPHTKYHLSKTLENLPEVTQPEGFLCAQITSLKVEDKDPQISKSAGYGGQRLGGNNRDAAVFNRSSGHTQSAKTHFVFSTPKPVLVRPPVQQAFVTSSTVAPGTTNQQPAVVVPAVVPAVAARASVQKREASRTSHPQLCVQNSEQYHHLGLPSPRPSPRAAVTVVLQEPRKLTKVYQSEKQSAVVPGWDVPGAPPATPAPEMLEKYEYIPSMGDVRAQRAVRARLELMERHEQKQREKLERQRERREKHDEQLRVKHTKSRQRKEIYALNRIMTQLEHQNFLDFCKSKNIDPKL